MHTLIVHMCTTVRAVTVRDMIRLADNDEL